MFDCCTVVQSCQDALYTDDGDCKVNDSRAVADLGFSNFYYACITAHVIDVCVAGR